MPGGRPTKIDQVIRTTADGRKITVGQQILDDLRVGMYLTHAAKRAGVHYDTLRDWLAKGNAPGARDPLRSFAIEADQARMTALARNLAAINKAANEGDWKAAAWFLERSFPGEFGQSNRLQISGDPDAPLYVQAEETVEVRVSSSHLNDDERTAEILAVLAEAGVLPDTVAQVIAAEE